MLPFPFSYDRGAGLITGPGARLLAKPTAARVVRRKLRAAWRAGREYGPVISRACSGGLAVEDHVAKR